jgi:hypothetical protein
MRVLLLLVALAVAAPAGGQAQSRPTDPPLVTAAAESWYQLREPLQFAGELYYPAGATVFFNGNHMVRTGHYNGVPLYADTTVEPYSIVLVPISRGTLRPYERRRSGDLAGTTGSRAPSFPVQLTRTATSLPSAPVAPTGLPATAGAVSVFTPEPAPAPAPAARAAAAPQGEPDAVGTTGVVQTGNRAAVPPLVTLRRPAGNDGVWIRFMDERWVSAGSAVAFDNAGFTYVGEHGTSPVFARKTLDEDVIYLPTARAGFVAPYRLKE